MIDLTPLRTQLPAIFEQFAELRRFFPALHLKRDGKIPIFLVGPGGTQMN